MKRFSVMLVTLLLVFSLALLAACGGQPESPPPGEGDRPVVTQSPDDPPRPTDPPIVDGDFQGIFPGVGVHEPRDFGGRTLTIAAWYADPIGPYLFVEEAPDPDSPNYTLALAMWQNARRVEQQFNVRFDQVSVPHEDYLTTLASSVLARNPIADLVLLEGPMQLESMGSIIQPMNANLPASDILGEQRFAGPTTQDAAGNIWAINPHSVITGAYVLGVNLEIIRAEGLPNPVDLYEAGNWNWDTMLEIMRGATKATSADGIIDQFGIAGQPGDIVMHLLGANDGILVDEDFNYGLRHPNSVAALEFVEQIFHESLWAAEAGGVMDTSNWDRNFYSGKREANAALFPTTTWGLDNFMPAFEFAVVPFPKGPNNTTGNTWLSGMRQGYSIPVGTEWTVEDIIIILDELYSWPGDHPEVLFQAGEIDWMRETFLTEADVQRAVRAGISANNDVGRDVPQYYWVLGNFASFFWNREMDVTQAIETERGPHQEMLDRRFRS